MQASLIDSPELQRVAQFLDEIGIPLQARDLPDGTFLPGLELGPGCVYVDYAKLLYPGDILHEAGHLAVTTGAQRRAVGSADLELPWPTDGEELAAILWSWAALRHLELAPEFVFHPQGYKGDSAWFMENLQQGIYIGMPFLEWIGLALSPERAQASGQPAFPAMLKWVRD